MALRVNSLYPLKLFNAAEINKVKLFIFLSTFHVYKMKQGKIFEGGKLNKNNNYTLSKIRGEQNLLKKIQKQPKL